MPQRTCGVDGCPKPHRARGLCVTHYNRQYMPDERHLKMVVACAWCGVECFKAATQRYERRFCSLHCRDTWRRRDRLPVLYVGTEHLPHVDAWTPRKRYAEQKLARALRSTSASRWVAGTCARCAEPFNSRAINSSGRYCSDDCKRAQGRSRRRARKRMAAHQPYARTDIFERDGYRCHLCKRMTKRSAVVPHPRAPVIDHLIPLGPGDDAPYNVATACFMCNSKRRDVGPAQLILFG